MIYNLRQFSKPEVLAKLNKKNLRCFLTKYPEYFNGKVSKLVIPDEITDKFDFAALAAEFSKPVFDEVTKMFEHLVLIEEMAKEKYAPIILEHVAESIYSETFEPQNHAMNNALLVFLNEPAQLYKIRDKHQLENPKSFIVARGKQNGSAVPISDDDLERFQNELDDVYEYRKYGRGIVVKHFEIAEGDYFLIRKGLPYTCKSTVDKELSTVNIFYREESQDIIIYNWEKKELKMNLGEERKWMRTSYPILFAKHFFHEEDFFDGTRKVSFQTFQELGQEALFCQPGGEITSVTVNALKTRRYNTDPTIFGDPDPDDYMDTMLVLKDYFRRAKAFNSDFSELDQIVEVKFVFHFGKETATVTLGQDGKCQNLKMDRRGLLIEKWLYEHGFLVA